MFKTFVIKTTTDKLRLYVKGGNLYVAGSSVPLGEKYYKFCFRETINSYPADLVHSMELVLRFTQGASPHVVIGQYDMCFVKSYTREINLFVATLRPNSHIIFGLTIQKVDVELLVEKLKKYWGKEGEPSASP